MATFKLTTNPDANNPVRFDLHLEGGKAVIIDGAEAIAQRARLRLSIFRGEWFADQREGTPWFELIFPNANNPALIRSVIRDVLLGIPGIVSIDQVNIDINRETRTLSGNISATGDEGEPIRLGFSSDFLVLG